MELLSSAFWRFYRWWYSIFKCVTRLFAILMIYTMTFKCVFLGFQIKWGWMVGVRFVILAPVTTLSFSCSANSRAIFSFIIFTCIVEMVFWPNLFKLTWCGDWQLLKGLQWRWWTKGFPCTSTTRLNISRRWTGLPDLMPSRGCATWMRCIEMLKLVRHSCYISVLNATYCPALFLEASFINKGDLNRWVKT